MTRRATGRVERRGEAYDIVLERTFRAPISEVWAAVTESDRLAAWIGTWTGDPASGHVDFVMTAEGATEPTDVRIEACESPRLLRVAQDVGDAGWTMQLDLAESDGTTTLTFTHLGVKAEEAEMIGPGWEYYLDRLVGAETGGEIVGMDVWEEYHPGMAEHYRPA